METKFLEGLGIDKDTISKIMAENGKDIQREKDKAAKLQTDLNAANDQIKTLSETVKGAEGKDETITTLQAKVKEFEDAEAGRKKQAQEAERRAGLKARFDGLKGENQYLNEGTESWIFGEFEKALGDKANTGKSDADIYAAITKDKNIFVNPQQQKFVNPKIGNPPASGADKQYLETKYKNNPFYMG